MTILFMIFLTQKGTMSLNIQYIQIFCRMQIMVLIFLKEEISGIYA